MAGESICNRVQADELKNRLDPEYYTKELLENESKLNGFDDDRVVDLVDHAQPNNIADLTTNGSFEFLKGICFNDISGIPFIRTQNIMDGYVDGTDLIYVNQECASMVAKARCATGDLIICRTGKVGSVSTVPEQMNGAAMNQNVTRLILKSGCDGDFLASFLNSKYGRKRFLREATGVIQKWINNEKIREIRLIRLKRDAEKYIGDKVRQAERLRAWAKKISDELDELTNPYQPIKKEKYQKFSRVNTMLLTDMLTATTYQEAYLENQKNLISQPSGTRRFTDLFLSITNGFDQRTELDSGIPYAKVADVRPGYIDLDEAPRIAAFNIDEATSNQKPRKGDLLLTRKGSFGIAAVVMEDTPFLASSEVFVCKPKSPELMPAVAHFVNSSAGNMQFWQFSTGTTMPGINQGNLRNIMIPDFSRASLESFNQFYEFRYLATNISKQLTTAAKLLVEALIENRITETQLIAAQHALDAGDPGPDRALLGRLRTDGLDGQGPPLFADLDRLYTLLEQAEAAAV